MSIYLSISISIFIYLSIYLSYLAASPGLERQGVGSRAQRAEREALAILNMTCWLRGHQTPLKTERYEPRQTRPTSSSEMIKMAPHLTASPGRERQGVGSRAQRAEQEVEEALAIPNMTCWLRGANQPSLEQKRAWGHLAASPGFECQGVGSRAQRAEEEVEGGGRGCERLDAR